MMNINPEMQDPNLIINNHSNFELAMNAIDEIKQKYILSVRDKEWDPIQEGHYYATFNVDTNNVRHGISWVTKKVEGLNELLIKYKNKTGIPCLKNDPSRISPKFYHTSSCYSPSRSSPKTWV